MKDIMKRIGQLFILGFPDVTPSKEFLSLIEEIQAGGVILFENNCPSYETISNNIAGIKQRIHDLTPFVAIDQEGGRVCRIKGAPAEINSAFSYGQEENIEKFIEDYSRSVMYMESLGINLNLAPVADIYLNDNNKVMKDRCFSTCPEQTALFVEAAVSVTSKSGLLSCLKHFPGLGDAEIDPHENTAVAHYDNIIWGQREKIPFHAGVKKGADLIMTTHLKVSKLDNVIATGSYKIIHELIRENLSFDGLVITDELTMKGAEPLGHYGERAVKAFNAGHDLLLFGQNFDAFIEAYEYFINAVERGEVKKERLQSALSRISGIKFKLERSVMK